MPVARLMQRARVAAWRDTMESRGHLERTAWATFVAQAVAGGKESWEDWQCRVGLLDNRPTVKEKGQVMASILHFLPPDDPHRKMLEAQGHVAREPRKERRRTPGNAPLGHSLVPEGTVQRAVGVSPLEGFQAHPQAV